MRALVPRSLVASALLLAAGGTCAAQPVPYWNAQWGRPQGASAGLGLLFGASKGESFKIHKKTLLIEARPGQDGGALHVGLVPASGSTSGFQFAGVALKGTVLRSWGGAASSLASGQTYAGAELHAAWVVKASLGVLWRVSGQQGKSSLLTWSVGIGL